MTAPDTGVTGDAFRAASEQAAVGMAHVNAEGRWRWVNVSLCEVAGRSATELLGFARLDVVHPDDAAAEEERASRLWSGEAGGYTAAMRWIRPDGATVWVELTAWLVRDSAPPCLALVVRDITERKRAERALRDSEQRFRAIFDTEPEGIKVFTRDGTILDINPAGLRLLEAERTSDVVGGTVAPAVLPEYREAYAALEAAAFRGESGALELEVEGRAGTRRWVETHAVPLRDQSGAVYAALSLTRDITAQKWAEKALRESETRLRVALDAAGLGTWEHDFATGRTRLDARVRRRSGLEGFDSVDAFMERIDPADRERVRRHLDDAADPARRSPISVQYRVRIGDHGVRWHWLQGRVEFSDPQGGPQGGPQGDPQVDPKVDAQSDLRADAAAAEPIRAIGTVQDVTDEKHRREEQLLLASAIDQATEGVFITDAEGTIQYVNPAFERITGYTREEALGQTPRILKSGRHGLDYYQGLWRELLAGRPVEQHITNRRKDGGLYTQESLITPVRTGGDRITHMVAVLRDVTHEVELQEQVRRSQKLEAVGRMAGGIAHDFNNLLTVIQGHAELALQEIAGDTARDDIGEVVAAARRARELTRQLLAFGRRQPVDPRVVDLGAVLRRSEKTLRRLAGDDVELLLDIGPEPGRVKADPGQLHQVLMNLVVNARDAMPRGGSVAITVGTTDLGDDPPAGFTDPVAPGEYVFIRVADTGAGIDERIRDRIFEPFFTTKPPAQGNGLGLSTVFGIVKQARGHIRVDSRPGEGATFEVFLPRTHEEPRPEPGEGPEPDAAAGGSETILVVEDQAAVRAVARRALQREGYRVLEAENGERALEVWEEHAADIDLVLTDVIMPAMDGHELALRIRAAAPHLPLLFMSGHAYAEAPDGIDAPVVRKPFETGALREAVRAALDSRGSSKPGTDLPAG